MLGRDMVLALSQVLVDRPVRAYFFHCVRIFTDARRKTEGPVEIANEGNRLERH